MLFFSDLQRHYESLGSSVKSFLYPCFLQKFSQVFFGGLGWLPGAWLAACSRITSAPKPTRREDLGQVLCCLCCFNPRSLSWLVVPFPSRTPSWKVPSPFFSRTLGQDWQAQQEQHSHPTALSSRGPPGLRCPSQGMLLPESRPARQHSPIRANLCKRARYTRVYESSWGRVGSGARPGAWGRPRYKAAAAAGPSRSAELRQCGDRRGQAAAAASW